MSPSLLILNIIVVLVFCQEFLAYWICRLHWHQLVPRSSDSMLIRMLLVADPQIQGFQNEPAVLGYLTRYDADKYLEKTFRIASSHSRPDVIIMLGDLTDEGNIATSSEFESYVKRFRRIFSLGLDRDVGIMYIPGDNDIGGEGDPVKQENVDRFKGLFSNDDLQMFKFYFLRFFYFNYFTEKTELLLSDHDNTNDHTYAVVLSHVPVLGGDSITRKALDLNPSVIFSAHDHKAVFLRHSARSLTKVQLDSSAVPGDIALQLPAKLQLDRITHEFVVPTCSYRMGVRNMGYGYVLFEQFQNGTLSMQYTVLWLPDRYRQLFIYLFAVAAIFGYFIAFNCCFSRRRFRLWK